MPIRKIVLLIIVIGLTIIFGKLLALYLADMVLFFVETR